MELIKYFVFDVESCGLHSEGFAVGFVAIDSSGITLETGLFSASMPESNEWVEANVLPHLPATPNCDSTFHVRRAFWNRFMHWKNQGALVVADCAWPVEARFLCDCIDDEKRNREWNGPYPLHDLGSILLARGINPLGKFDRLEGETPEHNPLCDAKQSARILIETLHAKPQPNEH